MPRAFATSILNLNVFDQLQGKWEAGFRKNRIQKLSNWIRSNEPEIVIFQEAQGDHLRSTESNDATWLKDFYSYRKYVPEMAGADGFSYGYWMAAKNNPVKEFSDVFFFPGGIERKTQAAIWKNAYQGKECLGVLSLHMSYQNTEVRQKEAQWIIDWIKKHENDCKHWIVAGDFNADKNDKEMIILFAAGFKNLVKDLKPTVGAYNPIRRIYGNGIPSRTIDWALGWNVEGEGKILFNEPLDEIWLSDHAGIFIEAK